MPIIWTIATYPLHHCVLLRLFNVADSYVTERIKLCFSEILKIVRSHFLIDTFTPPPAALPKNTCVYPPVTPRLQPKTSGHPGLCLHSPRQVSSLERRCFRGTNCRLITAEEAIPHGGAGTEPTTSLLPQQISPRRKRADSPFVDDYGQAVVRKYLVHLHRPRVLQHRIVHVDAALECGVEWFQLGQESSASSPFGHMEWSAGSCGPGTNHRITVALRVKVRTSPCGSVNTLDSTDGHSIAALLGQQGQVVPRASGAFCTFPVGTRWAQNRYAFSALHVTERAKRDADTLAGTKKAVRFWPNAAGGLAHKANGNSAKTTHVADLCCGKVGSTTHSRMTTHEDAGPTDTPRRDRTRTRHLSSFTVHHRKIDYKYYKQRQK
uniref:Uncharacterized protein n=1 Tax=Steinernema glaseri TaxID=37863 RepID=A0A1I7ZYH5_9BILA